MVTLTSEFDNYFVSMCDLCLTYGFRKGYKHERNNITGTGCVGSIEEHEGGYIGSCAGGKGSTGGGAGTSEEGSALHHRRGGVIAETGENSDVRESGGGGSGRSKRQTPPYDMGFPLFCQAIHETLQGISTETRASHYICGMCWVYRCGIRHATPATEGAHGAERCVQYGDETRVVR